MFGNPQDPLSRGHSLQAHLLGRVDFGDCLELQRRLAAQVGSRDDGQIVLLLCEHPPVITIGRGGSPGDVQTNAGTLASREIDVRWVKRGGPCLVHAPGQLIAYVLAPLRWHGLTVGEHLDRLQSAVEKTLLNVGVTTESHPGRHGLWGRTGQLAAVGVAVRDGVTSHGAFLNVSPPMGLFRLLETDPLEFTPMSCLVAERQRAVKMTSIRAELVRAMAAAFGCDRYHLHTGHPLLGRRPVRQR